MLQDIFKVYLSYMEDKKSDARLGVNLMNELNQGLINKRQYHNKLGNQQVSALMYEKLITEEYTNREMLESLKVAKGRTLDFGAGLGEISLVLALNGFEVTYYDVSDALNSFSAALFNHYDLTDTISSEIRGKYDTVFALNVIDHLDDPIETIRYFYDLLNKNGRLVLSVSYDCDANPIHINDENNVTEIEDFIRCYFEETEFEGQNDHQRIFLKRENIVELPIDRHGNVLKAPLEKVDFKKWMFKLSPDIEIIWNMHKYHIGFKQEYRSRLLADERLVKLLHYMANERSYNDLYKWAVNEYKTCDFQDQFESIIRTLWNKRIIRGKILKGGEDMTQKWIVADGNIEFQTSEEGKEIYFKFKEELAKHGILVKRFTHDPNCNH